MFRFLKRNDSEVITPEVVDVPVTTIQSNIAMALALCMEEYLRSVSKTSVDIPNRDTLVREYNTLVDAGLLEVKRKLNGEGPMFSDLGLEYANGAYYYVTGINYGYSETMLNNLKKYIESHSYWP